MLLFMPCDMLFVYAYFWLIAFTGHVSAQAPQSMQTFSSILYCVSPSLIASVGQTLAHEPQEIHSSLIVYAIYISSKKNYRFVL
jgi:hypothetical protein